MAGRKRKSTGNIKKNAPNEANDEELNGNGVENSTEKNTNVDTDKSDTEHLSDVETKQDDKKNKISKRGRKPSSKKVESEEENAEEEDSKYEVEAVVDDKIVKGMIHYLIRWKGYSAEDDTWEPENTLSCPELVKKYLTSKKKPSKKEELKKSSSKKSKRGSDEEEVLPEKNKKGNKSKSISPKKSKKGDQSSDDEDDKEDGKEYEVERIIEVHHRRNGGREFLVHWKGFSSKDNTWEPEENLNCPNLIDKFMNRVEEARSVESKQLRVNRMHTDRFSLSTQGRARRLSKRHEGKQR